MDDTRAEQVNLINGIRSDISDALSGLSKLTGETKPPVVQELVLAQRHLEDARMRLGIARTYVEGKDPFEGK